MIKRHIALALLVCSLCVWISGHEAVAAAPAIRVAVTKDTPQLTVFIRGPYRILDRHNNAVLA